MSSVTALWRVAVCLVLLAVTPVFSSRIPQPSRSLPSRSWHQDSDHPVHELFRRQTNNAQVGSPAWSAAYPTRTPDPSKTPQEWSNALTAAVAAGKIPNIPVPADTGGNPAYPSNVDPASQEICSGTYKCRIPGDIWDGPNGTIGIGFDDGPMFQSSPILYDFLKSNNQKATHFMIGVSTLQAPQIFLQAYDNGDDIAVHTYTHPHMTTLTNEQLVAEFGWTLQIIYDLTGGRVPKFWRPPYGDTDRRVAAIASEIFGLSCILWNQDTADWTISTGGTTPQAVATSLTQWINGPKSPGLIILEHELTNTTVQLFMDAYPQMKSQGWNTTSVAQLVAASVDGTTGNVYWNAPPGNQGAPTASMDLLGAGKFVSNSASATGASTASQPSGKAPASVSSPAPSGGGSTHVAQAGGSARASINFFRTIWTVVFFIFIKRFI